MAKAECTKIFTSDIESIYRAITDYAAYPEFVDGVSEVEIIEQEESFARVQYSLNLIKKFKYLLRLEHTKPTRVSWCLESGDIFKSNEGYWELKDLGDGTTEVTYALEIDIKGFVPKAIVNKLAARNLPAMMQSYEDRAKGLSK